MIRLFNHTETNFTHNGVHVLDDIVIGDTCILNNEINGVYSLECEVAMFNNSKWKDIEAEMFLIVPTPNGEQIFRIKEIVKGFNTLKIYAKHVFFDLENNFILDTNVVKKDGRSAIAQILGGMSNNMLNAYTGTSDISIINSSRLVRKNVVTALIGNDDNSFLNRWGGELQVDNFNFAIKNRIGNNRGFQVRYGKNATGYEGNINTYNLCTRIVPVGFDGIMLEGTKWVDSPNIAKYPQIYTYEVKFDDIKVKENADDEEGFETIEEARDALRQAALNHFNNTKCDLPTFSARINFITLENTEEYKDIRFLEKVYLGDDVSIYLSNIDVNASSRIVKTKYNFFTKKYIEVEIGEIKPNVFKQLINIKETIDSIVEDLGGNTWQDIINKSLDEATKLMEEGLKDSHVITMKNQIVIGDAPDIKDMVNCIVFNKNGIGFSNNGYLPDRLVSAMTIDGKINASCITTGELNAALIKTGVLMSANGKTWINMEDGTFNFSDKIIFNGEKIEILLEKDKTIKETIEETIEESENKSGNMIQNSNVLVDLTGFEAIGGNIVRYEYIPPINIDKEEEFIPGESAPNVSDEITTTPPTNGDDMSDIEVAKPPTTSKPIKSNTQIHFIYTKETGDSILITCDNGKTILIDSVDNRLLSSNLPNSIEPIIKYIKNLGINKIDYIINTHFHSDHAGGLDEIMDTFDVKDGTFIYKEFDNSKMPAVETEWKTNLIKTNAINAATKNGMNKITPKEKQKFVIDNNTYFEIYNATHIDYSDYNSSSLVIYFVHGDNKFLLLGDVNPTRQATLYSSLPKNVDVVKDSHHGYNATINTDLIKRCNPKDVIVTRNEWNNLAYNRAYNSIGMWQSYEKNIYTLFKTGSHIIITSNGNDYTLNTNAKFFFENCWLKFNNDDSSWCYFKPGGNYAKNETLVLENKKYDFNSDGFCINPFSPR